MYILYTLYTPVHAYVHTVIWLIFKLKVLYNQFSKKRFYMKSFMKGCLQSHYVRLVAVELLQYLCHARVANRYFIYLLAQSLVSKTL